jgi:hypothetical protein
MMRVQGAMRCNEMQSIALLNQITNVIGTECQSEPTRHSEVLVLQQMSTIERVKIEMTMAKLLCL